MIPRRYSSKAIVLLRKNYGEADRIITLFTRDYGKITVIAKGVRKPISRKRGSLEIFSYISFSAARGKSLDVMIESSIIDSFSSIRKDVKRVSVAYFFLETINKLVRDEEPDRILFDLILSYLDSLGGTNTSRKLRYEFIFEVLVHLGFWPHERKLLDPDAALENIVEREMVTKRVGKLMISE